jgi:integrase
MAKVTYKNAAQLDALKVQGEPYQAADEGCKGLTVRVMPSGSKIFRWNSRRVSNKQKPLVLGEYSEEFTLADARQKLEQAKKKNKAGMDAAAILDKPKTIEELGEQFYKVRILPKRDRPEKVRQVLDADINPAIGHMKVDEHLKTIHLRPPITNAVNRGSPGQARTVLTVLKQMIGFAASNGYLESDISAPLKGDDLGAEEGSRDRTLSPDEIKWLWVKLDTSARLTAQTVLALKLLLLTGVRSGELRLAQWREVDFNAGTWTIPVDHQKNRNRVKNPQPFVIPMSDTIEILFGRLHTITGAAEYVLASPVDPEHPIDRCSLKNSVGRIIKSENKSREKEGLPRIDHFVPHDLRRTMRTLITEKCAVQPHIAELCLGHSLGGIFRTYDTGGYLNERLDALQQWSDYIDKVVNDTTGRVIELRGASA